jgi:hypothetical protein
MRRLLPLTNDEFEVIANNTPPYMLDQPRGAGRGGFSEEMAYCRRLIHSGGAGVGTGGRPAVTSQ